MSVADGVENRVPKPNLAVGPAVGGGGAVAELTFGGVDHAFHLVQALDGQVGPGLWGLPVLKGALNPGGALGDEGVEVEMEVALGEVTGAVEEVPLALLEVIDLAIAVGEFDLHVTFEQEVMGVDEGSSHLALWGLDFEGVEAEGAGFPGSIAEGDPGFSGVAEEEAHLAEASGHESVGKVGAAIEAGEGEELTGSPGFELVLVQGAAREDLLLIYR